MCRSTFSSTRSLVRGEWSASYPGRFTPRERALVPIGQEARWAPEGTPTPRQSSPYTVAISTAPGQRQSRYKLRTKQKERTWVGEIHVTACGMSIRVVEIRCSFVSRYLNTVFKLSNLCVCDNFNIYTLVCLEGTQIYRPSRLQR
jgi:hypothetical protein